MIFALVSLPLASSAIIYFINHRYDGAQLWDLKLVPGTCLSTCACLREKERESVCVCEKLACGICAFVLYFGVGGL